MEASGTDIQMVRGERDIGTPVEAYSATSGSGVHHFVHIPLARTWSRDLAAKKTG